jgi:hypothetical protein
MPAGFNVCSCCGKHGRVVLGPESAFQGHALNLVRTGVQHERLTDVEAERVMTEILASSLPVTLEEVDVTFQFNMEVVNYARMQGVLSGTIEDADLCALLSDPAGKDLIPTDFLEVARATLKKSQPS